jgi:hypothetical protein
MTLLLFQLWGPGRLQGHVCTEVAKKGMFKSFDGLVGLKLSHQCHNLSSDDDSVSSSVAHTAEVGSSLAPYFDGANW